MSDRIINLKAMAKWKAIPADIQARLISNVYCKACGETSIVDFEIKDDEFGIVLVGRCKKCNGPVARMIED
ncbi:MULTISPECIES: hypothetical protein [unclassified Fusibacter]|uniref:hypothetical protein n=1 Tax=unclassified Fusibacter TaxID=2624464 RepID=UPI0010116011|nr:MULTISPECIES: hypothetical protein [unclassified Fusibacter]MCK8058406.1 hypothetical protein [Fusibacter sp. A2]NPE23877.1 hypothetical protein [Fusibacter sp. A1]RXV58528.1 hypothetical protein DWB64_19005 [Fusibacter sp. A1]